MDVLVPHGSSKSRACARLALHRSTFDYQSRPDQNAELEHQLRALAEKHPRYGDRRIWTLVRRDRKGTKKRIYRLWRRSRLQVRTRARKRRRRSGGSGIPIKALHPGHVWTYDFIHDRTLNGTELKVLTVMDDTRRSGP